MNHINCSQGERDVMKPQIKWRLRSTFLCADTLHAILQNFCSRHLPHSTIHSIDRNAGPQLMIYLESYNYFITLIQKLFKNGIHILTPLLMVQLQQTFCWGYTCTHGEKLPLSTLDNLTQLVIKSKYPVYALHFLANRFKYQILPLKAILIVQTPCGNFNKRISPRSIY